MDQPAAISIANVFWGRTGSKQHFGNISAEHLCAIHTAQPPCSKAPSKCMHLMQGLQQLAHLADCALKGCRKDKPGLVVHNAMLQCSETFAVLLATAALIPTSIEPTNNNFTRPTKAAFTL